LLTSQRVVHAQCFFAAEKRGTALAVNHGHLSILVPTVGAERPIQGSRRLNLPGFEKVEDVRGKGRQGDVLGRHRTHTCTCPGAPSTHSDTGRADGDPKLSGFRATSDNRECHVVPYALFGFQSSGITAITSISMSHCGWPRALTTRPVEMGNTP